MNYEAMKRLIECAGSIEEQDAYIKAFEVMTGLSFEVLFMTEEDCKMNIELHQLQQN